MSYADFLKSHNISEKCGFVLENPVSQLDDSTFRQWNNLCKEVTNGTEFETVCRTIESIDDFDVKALKSHEELRYAKLMLETIVQGYLYMDINAYEGENMSEVPDRLPSEIANPLLEISEQLGMKPVISHASITLANVKLSKGHTEFVSENLNVIMPRAHQRGFNNNDANGYEWFFQVTAEIEAMFTSSILSIGSVCYASNDGDSTIDLDKALTAIQESCEKAKLGFKKYRVNLSPSVFFYEVRPALWGYDQLPNGLKFGSSEEPVKYRGASASESTSMQVIDAFLNIKYSDMQKGFMVGNRAFMPSGHRKFIEYVEGAVSKDGEALSHRIQEHALFPSVMRTLRELRSEHINLVTLFVVTQMKSNPQIPVSAGKMLIGFMKSFRDACVVPENSE